MIQGLMSLPKQAADLLARLTSTRAANLDKLDALVSSRAAGSTALSNATWTSARAGYLDKLNLAGVLASVKSIQYGTATIVQSASTGTATIAAVSTSRTLVLPLGSISNNSGAAINDVLASLALTDSTTITASRGSTSATYRSITRFVVLEFY